MTESDRPILIFMAGMCGIESMAELKALVDAHLGADVVCVQWQILDRIGDGAEERAKAFVLRNAEAQPAPKITLKPRPERPAHERIAAQKGRQHRLVRGK